MAVKRVRSAEEDIFAIQQELIEYRQWRAELEPRITEKIDQNFKLFQRQNKKNDDEFFKISQKFIEVNKQLNSLDSRLKSTNNTIQINKDQVLETIAHLNNLKSQVNANWETINTKLTENVT